MALEEMMNIYANADPQDRTETEKSYTRRRQTLQHTGDETPFLTTHVCMCHMSVYDKCNFMSVVCLESDCVRTRSSRACIVCLAMLCVLLLTAVVVLGVKFNKNNTEETQQQLNKEERACLSNNCDLIKQRENMGNHEVY